MATPLRAAWVGDDLLMRSRVAAAVPGVALTGATEPTPGIAAVFVDLNRAAADRISRIERWHEQAPDVTVVAFCGHEEDEVRRQAMAAGASLVVTNGALAATARRVLEGDDA